MAGSGQRSKNLKTEQNNKLQSGGSRTIPHGILMQAFHAELMVRLCFVTSRWAIHMIRRKDSRAKLKKHEQTYRRQSAAEAQPVNHKSNNR